MDMYLTFMAILLQVKTSNSLQHGDGGNAPLMDGAGSWKFLDEFYTTKQWRQSPALTLNKSEPTQVVVSFHDTRFISINEELKEISFSTNLKTSWIDERLNVVLNTECLNIPREFIWTATFEYDYPTSGITARKGILTACSVISSSLLTDLSRFLI